MKHDTEVFLISKTGLKVNPYDTVKVDENIGYQKGVAKYRGGNRIKTW